MAAVELAPTRFDRKEGKVVYHVYSRDAESGALSILETNTRPLLGGYLSERTYGDPGYCPTATWRHKDSKEKTGEFSNLVFFDSVDAAVAAGFRPCGSCWVKDAKETSQQHLSEYLEACRRLNIEPQTVGRGHPSEDTSDQHSSLTEIKRTIDSALESVSHVDNENMSVVDHIFSDVSKLVSETAPDQRANLDALYIGLAALIREGRAGRLQQPKERAKFIGEYIMSAREALVKSLKHVVKSLGLDRRQFQGVAKVLAQEDEVGNVVSESKIIQKLFDIAAALDGKKTNESVDVLNEFVTIAEDVYGKVHNGARKNLKEIFRESFRSFLEIDRKRVLGYWGTWMLHTQKMDRSGDLVQDEQVALGDMAKDLPFIETFLNVFRQEELDSFGKYLFDALQTEDNKSQSLDALLETHPLNNGIGDYPRGALNAMVMCFEEAGLISRSSTEKLKLAPKIVDGGGSPGKDKATLSHHYLSQVLRAKRRLDLMKEIAGEPIHSLDDAIRIYESHNKERPMTELRIPGADSASRVAFLAGIALGHQDSALPFVQRFIESIKKLPDDKKPHVIVVNNLLAGAFENRDKNQKVTLVPEFQTLESQFSAARKVVLDELTKLHIPVVLNLGSPDWEIARDIVLRMLRYQFQLVGHIPYYQQDELQRMKEWSVFDKFVVDVALPYCLRKGELLFAHELLILRDVSVELERAKLEGREPHISAGDRAVIDVDKVPVSGKIDFGDNLFITDNVALQLGTGDHAHKAIILNDFNFSTAVQPPLYQEPMKSLQEYVIQSMAAGRPWVGNSHTILNQHEFTALVLDANGTWVDSMPAARTYAHLETRGSLNRARDAARRVATTRRTLGSTAGMLVETTPTGRKYFPMTDELMDLADSADRTTIIYRNDEQIGSVTARPDLFVKAIDIETELLKENSVIVVEGGDKIQGKNYKGKEHQERAVGMQVDTDDQLKFAAIIQQLAYHHVSRTHLENIKDVLEIVGNHELNSGFAINGAVHASPIVAAWNTILANGGSVVRPRFSENVVTQDGSFFRGWVGNLTVGGYHGVIQHYPLKKGGKGMGTLPVYQAWPLLSSYVENAADINFFNFFHYHQGSAHLAAGKIVTISPSKANQSEFEHYLGMRSTPGMMMLHLGGNLPPAIEFVTENALARHEISSDSYFSDSHLNSLGFFTDGSFNSDRDGFIPWVEPFSAETLLTGLPNRHPQSALQKLLWHIATTIPIQADTKLGA